MKHVQNKLVAKGPKRILSLDGGGIKGALTLSYLEKIEELLRKRCPVDKQNDFRLSDYFDMIGGTSTGAIIAAGLSIGLKVSELSLIYENYGEKIFKKVKNMWTRNTEYRFDATVLEEILDTKFTDIKLGDDRIKSWLTIVTKRVDTGSYLWPVHNSPSAKYYSKNKNIMLKELIRASSAAPTYFSSVTIDVGEGEMGSFIDGGVSVSNNPAFQLLLLATLKNYKINWDKGDENLFIVSIGTGTFRYRMLPEEVANSKKWDWGRQVPTIIMNDASKKVELLMSLLSSDSSSKLYFDSELEQIDENPFGNAMFQYLRYDVKLEPQELRGLGFDKYVKDIDSLRLMEEGANVNKLFEIGRKKAALISDEDFPARFDIK
ncbi:MAG: patatin-like phospholipase family protein [Bacteroidota bacterium]